MTGAAGGERATDAGPLPRTLALFPLSGALLLPGTELPLNVFEPRYLDMVRDALDGNRIIGIIQPLACNDRSFEPTLRAIGCAGRISEHKQTSDGRIVMTVTGLCRFDVLDELERTTSYRQVVAGYRRFSHDLTAPEAASGIERESLIALITQYFTSLGLDADWSGVEVVPDRILINSLAAVCPFEGDEKQALLEATTTLERGRLLIALLELAVGASSSGAPLPIH